MVTVPRSSSLLERFQGDGELEESGTPFDN
jgi:hypothetical protein